MLSTFQRPTNHEDGFTLIELLVVIIIIGILAAIAIPLFLDQRKLAVDASVKADVRSTVANVQTWQANTEANRTKAEANTGAYVADGGKIAQTPGNSIGVSIDASGAATVCAYNAGGKTYLADSAAYVFNPATGQFNTGACAASSTTGGTSGAAAGSGAAASTTVAAYDFENGTQTWQSPGLAGETLETATIAGRKALHYTHPNFGSANLDLYGNTVAPLIKGKTYTLTAYIYIAAPTSNVSGFVFHNAIFANTTATSSTRVTTAGSWQQVTQTFVPTSNNGGYPYLRLAQQGGGTLSAVDVYLDDWTLSYAN